jgi:hypothetical protein
MGVGPFIAKLVQEGFFAEQCAGDDTGCVEQFDAMSPIFNGGFQIMTWFSCMAGILNDSIGARWTAIIGMAIACTGHQILAQATAPGAQTTPAHATVFMLGYGLIGAGGNMLWIPAFQFTALFEAQGVPISILSGIFNVSGI